ncbi:MAG TPA: ATP-binding protein [Casimicrobiaceae bacterium]|nr:ATP-binding protein [Casimicrobiaceae bacterium]
MTFWPRSLFGRLALLLLMVVVVSQGTAILLYRQDRAALVARQFSDTKVLQLQALRAALAATELHERSATLTRLGEEYGARIVSDDGRGFFGVTPQNPLLVELGERLRTDLGPETELRLQPRQQLLWIKMQAGDHAYWAGFHWPRPSDAAQSRALEWSLIALVVLLASAYAFARYLSRPLRQLNDAVANVGAGKAQPPLPEKGPSEIVNLNRGFNQMLANLRQAEQDRALLLAGVSHDLRTPLARLRLGVEVGTHDEQMREGMAADIEEMDKIIGQFLDFGRDDRDVALEMRPLDEIVAPLLERYHRAGSEVHYSAGDLPALPMRATAMSRLLSNLIDNALRYGGTPVDVSARSEGTSVVIEVGDRGPGIPPEQVDRLKRPFTRGDPARSGASGAGLGLAIVERIARLHGARFDVLAREGGGTLARVTMPAGAGP